MKKSIYFFIIAILFFTACSKNFIDIKPAGTNLEENYYKTPEEAFNGLVSIYDPLGQETGNAYMSRVMLFNVPSDDCYAGGGSASDIPGWQAWNNFTVDPATGPQLDLWNRNFTGVYRANYFLTRVDGAGLTEAVKKRYVAEAKFLRGYYYFDLVRLFKNVPLFTVPVPTDQYFTQVQAKPEDVWAQIEKDLKEAMPDLPVAVPIASEGGRVTQGAAKALLAKVILYQNNNARMGEAVTLLEDVNKAGNIYGYQLVSNFASIFRPDNKFNSESIFEITHTNLGRHGWDQWPNFDGNVGVQLIGARGYSGPVYEAGWGFNPVTTQLYDAIKNDPRYRATIVNMDSLKNAGVASYEPSYQNTGFFVEKYAPKTEWKSTLSGDPALNYPNDYIEIRLADTYLMEAEAILRSGGDVAKAGSYLNAVRARVGLPAIAVTLDNVYNERRLELATEGHRFFDLVRTGKAASALDFKGFKAGRNELLPIPLTELNNTKLVQNPGY